MWMWIKRTTMCVCVCKMNKDGTFALCCGQIAALWMLRHAFFSGASWLHIKVQQESKEEHWPLAWLVTSFSKREVVISLWSFCLSEVPLMRDKDGVGVGAVLFRAILILRKKHIMTVWAQSTPMSSDALCILPALSPPKHWLIPLSHAISVRSPEQSTGI